MSATVPGGLEKRNHTPDRTDASCSRARASCVSWVHHLHSTTGLYLQSRSSSCAVGGGTCHAELRGCQAAVFASLHGCHASCASLGDRTTCLAGASLLLLFLSLTLSFSLSLCFPLSLLRAVKSNPALNAAVKMTLGRELEQLKMSGSARSR